MRRTDEDGVPIRHYVQLGYCADPQCYRVHATLFDEDELPVAHFAVPEGLAENITDLEKRLREQGAPGKRRQ